MTTDDLLPPNATVLERALSVSTDLLTRLAGDTEALAGFKTDPADSLLPWLIWEYGLGELLPYLPEPRRAIAEGIRWQRLRGTPAALTTALSWIGATATVEQETPGIHFAEFQFDPGQVLDDDAAIANLIAIARLSAPARSRLSRIYHGWDLRRLVLDESRLGEALLSDHSGVFWRDGQTKLSFGRVRKFAQPAQDIALIPAREAVRFAVARLIDRYLLDFSALGDPGHTPNEEILHAHLFALANALGLADPLGLRPERKFCKAMVVLSDSTPLGDTNANLPRFVWQEAGAPITLGSGDRLSATPHRLVRVEVLERFDAQYPADLIVPAAAITSGHIPTTGTRVSARADALLGVLRLGDPRGAWDVLALTRTYGLIQDPLPDPASLRPRLYQRAQVVLSEVALGDVNSRTPRRALYRTRPLPRLGDLTLGDQAEIEWRALTEMQICISGFTEFTPYVFEDARPSLLRLLTRSAEAGAASQVFPARVPVLSTRAVWSGQTWTGVRWPTSSWTDTRELIGSAHGTQS
ncbi:phage tail protein [Allochromatium humboldtianum]|uniref:Phage tail protein n=1 Tax=Allochromatium humboldtianum TaxID=504901 RepID=A0A850RBB7_9GAMM|nr:phage tail protein [Allochromatium humboldtianum]NVZ10065.1 phage tail protein [Allochromatium humboldtianum]